MAREAHFQGRRKQRNLLKRRILSSRFLLTCPTTVKCGKKRFRIETFFSDQKSRGFHLHKSRLSDLERLARLMIAACLAYIWIIYLGVVAQRDGWVVIIHRTDRCDLSLFQLGLDLLEHFLDECRPIPVAFQMPLQEKSVR